MVLGASAGGLEALEAFAAHIPADSGAAYVVVQHLPADQPSTLTSLLRRHAAVPVVDIADGQVVRKHRLHVLPPGTELALHAGRFGLRPAAPTDGPRLGIDAVLRAVADDVGPGAVGVILSGMGTDGLLGLGYLRDRGGLAVAQTPETARFDSMPRAVIDAGIADIVAPPEAMPERIAFYLRRGLRPERSQRADDDAGDGGTYDRITALLRQAAGNDFSAYKPSTVRRRVERRMAIHQIETVAVYLRYLQRNPAEVAILHKELLVGVTEFFRDPEVWDILRDEVFPELIAAQPNVGPLRVWVPACSTGEEAYSLAIAFREAVERLDVDAPPTLQIFATDLNAEAIAVARVGVYGTGIESSVSAERRQRFFTRERGGYRIRKDVRALVTFATHNILTDPPFTRLDLVSCRNLLIYLTAEAQRRVLATFHYALAPGGRLLLGTAESAGDVESIFAVTHPKARIYRRLDTPRSASGRDLPLRAGAPPTPREEADRTVHVPSLHEAASDYLLARFGPSAVLVDAAGEIVWLSGRPLGFLEPSTGKATWSLAAMLRESLRADVLRAVRTAAGRTGPVQVRIPAVDGDRAVEVRVERLSDPPPLDGLFLVLFRRAAVPADRAARSAPNEGGRRPGPAAGRELEAEVRRARADAREARASLQAVREELGSALEEMQSTNEELQSTNEELTTSKEELQSMNEELQTINAEQVARMETLSQAQSDMNNLLNSTEIATIFLGQGLILRRFTAGAASLYRLLPTDVGRPITDIASDLPYAELTTDVAEVLRTLVPRQRQVQASDGRWFSVRVLPYRTIDDMIDGAVLTFSDVTDSKRLELELRERERQLHAFVYRAPSAILVLDEAGVARDCNAAAGRLLGRDRDSVIGRTLEQLPLPASFRQSVADARTALAAEQPPRPFSARFVDADGSTRQTYWMVGGVDGVAGDLVMMGQIHET